MRPTRRRFLAAAAAVAGAPFLPLELRLGALEALAVTGFSFSDHERKVLAAAADTVGPAATVQTRLGPKGVPSAGQAGAVDYIQNLLSGELIFAAGVRRPPYVLANAPVFPRSGADPLWTVKRMGWFGDPQARPTRPYPWPSELARLQDLYRKGVQELDAATAPLGFDQAPPPQREAVLRALQAKEVAAYDGQGEGRQPFFLTLLDHVAEACFGDPVYGGNRGWVYWDMLNFSGPSFVNAGGPGPGQGWTWQDLTGPFQRTG